MSESSSGPPPFSRRWLTAVALPQVAISVVTVAATGVFAVIVGLLPRPAFLDRVDPQGVLDVRAFLPEDFRVTERWDRDLDGRGESEVVVAAIGPADAYGKAAATLLVLSWDGFARRWTKLYDASRVHVDAYPGFDPLLNQSLNIERLSVYFLRRSGRQVDAAVHALLSKGSTAFQRVSILRYSQDRLVELHRSEDLGWGKVGVRTGRPDELEVSSTWRTAATGPFEHDYTRRLRPGEYNYSVVADGRPWLGVVVGNDLPDGALVLWVASNGPVAGHLRSGDLIRSLAGHPPVDPEGLRSPYVAYLLSNMKPGVTVTLEVVRDGAPLNVTVVLGDQRDDREFRPTVPSVGGTFAAGDFGVEVVVEPTGALGRAGVAKGAVIEAVADELVSVPSEVALRLIQRGPGDVAIRFRNPGSRQATEAVVTAEYVGSRGEAFGEDWPTM